ncbi:hypothetical protein [Bacillus toyonensis]|nr:hypothetical protein [Bacillus toyonensis]
MDDLGRCVLPKEMRKTLDLIATASAKMFVQDGIYIYGNKKEFVL